MRIIFIHQNYPAQLGHIAERLAARDWQCTFVSQAPPGISNGVERIQYQITGGATESSHYCARTFENTLWHCEAIFNALRQRPDLRPDLIVGHSGFGSTLFLRERFPRVPVVNLFEYFYRPHASDSDMNFRHDLGWILPYQKYQRAAARNAMPLLDLHNCQLGYCPTNFQLSRFPQEYRSKLRVIFDGVDRSIFHGHDEALRPPVAQRASRTIAGIDISPTTRVVTYVARGFESMRGFDIFIRAANLIAKQYPDVVFIIAGADQICYGGDLEYIAPHSSFKQWTLAKYPIDESKFHFVGLIPPMELASLLAASDLHIYLTVPFVLSWSMMNAMSCGAIVLGSSTAPVMEMIRDGENGLLVDFFDPDAIAEKALRVLNDPDQFRPLGRAAEEMIESRYSIDAILPSMIRLYEQAAAMPVDAPFMPKDANALKAIESDEMPTGQFISDRRPKGDSPFHG